MFSGRADASQILRLSHSHDPLGPSQQNNYSSFDGQLDIIESNDQYSSTFTLHSQSDLLLGFTASVAFGGMIECRFFTAVFLQQIYSCRIIWSVKLAVLLKQSLHFILSSCNKLLLQKFRVRPLKAIISDLKVSSNDLYMKHQGFSEFVLICHADCIL